MYAPLSQIYNKRLCKNFFDIPTRCDPDRRAHIAKDTAAGRHFFISINCMYTYINIKIHTHYISTSEYIYIYISTGTRGRQLVDVATNHILLTAAPCIYPLHTSLNPHCYMYTPSSNPLSIPSHLYISFTLLRILYTAKQKILYKIYIYFFFSNIHMYYIDIYMHKEIPPVYMCKYVYLH